jgi:hypothetical protein
MLARSNTLSDLKPLIPKVFQTPPLAPKGAARIVSGTG